MLIGAGLGMGALATYQKIQNGDMQRTINNLKNKAQKVHENMM